MWLCWDDHTYAPCIAKHNQNTAWRQFRARECFLGASFAQGHAHMHTYMYTYMHTYMYTYAFEVKNRIPCMSLLTTRLLAAVWLKLACSSRLSRVMEPAVPDMWHCYVQLSFGCDQSRQNFAFFLRQNRASSAQALRKATCL